MPYWVVWGWKNRDGAAFCDRHGEETSITSVSNLILKISDLHCFATGLYKLSVVPNEASSFRASC